MKIKSIVVACAALCSASVFAAGVLNPATTAPTVTFYVGGASAQYQAVAAIAPSLFDTPANVVAITQTAGEKAYGWYGVSTINGVAQNLLVLYNKTNGSFSGMNQLINSKGAANVGTSFVPGSGPGMAFDGKILSIGPSGDSFSGALGSCNLTTAPYTCTTSDTSKDAFVQIDLALTDVYPWEALPNDDAGNPVYAPGKGGNVSASAITTITTGLEGFGVAVNPALYLALQKAEGLVPSTATTPVMGAAAQPNINSVDYTSLVSQLGAIKSASSLLSSYQAGNSDATALTLVRRVAASGTQAASGIYFLNNVCGNSSIGGGLNPTGLGDANAPTFNVQEQASTGGITAALTGTATAGYAIGVLSFENTDAVTSATAWHFVKLDGVSPTYVNGVYDATQRQQMINGNYKFAVEMAANYLTSSSNPAFVALQNKFIAGLQNSTLHNLVGIGYFDNVTQSSYQAVLGQQARYSRGLNFVTGTQNNCAPLADVNN